VLFRSALQNDRIQMFVVAHLSSPLIRIKPPPGASS